MRGRNAVIEGFDDPDDIGVPTTGILRGTSSSTASMTSNLSWVTLVNMRERQRVDLRGCFGLVHMLGTNLGR